MWLLWKARNENEQCFSLFIAIKSAMKTIIIMIMKKAQKKVESSKY